MVLQERNLNDGITLEHAEQLLLERRYQQYSTPFSQPGGPEFVRRDRRIDAVLRKITNIRSYDHMIIGHMPDDNMMHLKTSELSEDDEVYVL